MPPSSPDFDERSFSTDARNLLKLANAISTRSVSIDLANIKLGPIHHARWLTKAARILRTYITTDKPSKNLRILATYVMKVYIPMYFNVKYYNSMAYGSVLFFKFIQWTNYLPPNLLSVVHSVMSANCYFASSENVLLAMVCHNVKPIRQMAIDKIKHIRSDLDRTTLREYKKPKINFDCTHFSNMIDLNDDDILHEPPYTRDIPLQHLTEDYYDSDEVMINVEIPCHIQSTERNVQEMTRASKHVTEKHKSGFIATSMESREKRPKTESKRDFK